MFYSTYIPVNVNRMNCAIYSNEKVFDKEHLLRAYEHLKGINCHNGVTMTHEGVSFIDSPEICWSIAEVYLAHEALMNAEKNKFSFYAVRDLDGIPQLFVSRAFSGQRILVNAFTTRSILVTNPQHVSKIASMIDKQFAYVYCQELYSMLEAISLGNNRYLDALIVGAGSKDEYLVLNQYTITYGNIIDSIGADTIADLNEMVDKKLEKNEQFIQKDGYIKRTDVSYWPTLLVNQVKFISNLYENCKSKKKNYISICNEDLEDALFMSTNGRYLVKARTLECITIGNTQVRELLKVMSKRQSNTAYDLDWIWRLAGKVKQ